MKITMKRGDTRHITLAIDKALYSVGQMVTFMAKKGYDNDPTNANALINKTYGDSDILEQNDTKVVYKCTLLPSDTANLEIDLKKGKGELKLIGEFEIRDGDQVRTLPSGKNFVEIVIYPDIKMGA